MKFYWRPVRHTEEGKLLILLDPKVVSPDSQAPQAEFQNCLDHALHFIIEGTRVMKIMWLAQGLTASYRQRWIGAQVVYRFSPIPSRPCWLPMTMSQAGEAPTLCSQNSGVWVLNPGHCLLWFSFLKCGRQCWCLKEMAYVIHLVNGSGDDGSVENFCKGSLPSQGWSFQCSQDKMITLHLAKWQIF